MKHRTDFWESLEEQWSNLGTSKREDEKCQPSEVRVNPASKKLTSISDSLDRQAL